MQQAMLTTTDNPYNPFDDYDAWYAFDSRMGYHTPGLVARLTLTSDELSEDQQNFAIEQVIDEIVKENFLGLYIKVVKQIEDLKE